MKKFIFAISFSLLFFVISYNKYLEKESSINKNKEYKVDKNLIRDSRMEGF